MYPKLYRTLSRHWLHRFGFFLLGIVLLYAPFALLTRLVLWVSGSPLLPDVHRICMRMPIQWLSQPWMYGTIIGQPAYLGAVLVLPAIAFAFGPLFCGWMCPAGHLTEFLSRLVPPRFQIDLAGKVAPASARYGFLVGFMVVGFIGGNTCCSFCNFTYAQSIVSATTGDMSGFSHWASFTTVAFVLWFIVLGLFTKGGRGWCNLLCPAGALQGYVHSVGSKLGLGRKMHIDGALCRKCGVCTGVCSAWAISDHGDGPQISAHSCSVCKDCQVACSQHAISYGRVAVQVPVTPMEERPHAAAAELN